VAEGTADALKSAAGAASLDEVFLALTAAPGNTGPGNTGPGNTGPGNTGADGPGAGDLASVNDLVASRAAANSVADRTSEVSR
jgi:hypothetical protein